MCGISGIVNFDNTSVEKEDLKLMMRKMKHRGPDDEGIYIDNNIGLGFVRLSILDLSLSGHQPMHSHNNRYVIIFNGEVFNYLEIKEELKNEFKFSTGTDTEVVLAAFQKWGAKCLDRFNGMFAFVVYDKLNNQIFAARDRFGIKPFYYYVDDKQFIFASEIKSILPLIERRANMKIIYDYLMFNRTDHTEETFFEGVKKMKHGTFMVLQEKKIEFHRWYDLSEKVAEKRNLSAMEYRELLNDSIKLRLRADVPVGVSLSGGIDSSSITSSLLQDFNLKELNTFSAVFDSNEPTDESEFINEYKSLINNMYFTTPNAETFFNDFETFIEAHNEPCPDLGPYIQYKVMELASAQVKVTLDGQGADEQLAGYHNFFSIYYLELIRKIRLGKWLKENVKYFRKHGSLDVVKYMIYYLLPSKMQNKISRNIYPSINKDLFKQFNNDLSVNKMLYKPQSLNQSLLQHFEYKLEHLLRWEDLNSMHFSIESRVPFLDYRLVEATLSTPPEYKISDGETKFILREAVKDILPEKIANRKDKKGFSNPRAKWFRTDMFKNYILELINSDTFVNRGIFDSEQANIQFKKHLNEEKDISPEIWKWINVELWFRKFID